MGGGGGSGPDGEPRGGGGVGAARERSGRRWGKRAGRRAARCWCSGGLAEDSKLGRFETGRTEFSIPLETAVVWTQMQHLWLWGGRISPVGGCFGNSGTGRADEKVVRLLFAVDTR